jgi:hypothetical protein
MEGDNETDGLVCLRSFMRHTLLLGNRRVTKAIIEWINDMAKASSVLVLIQKWSDGICLQTLDNLSVVWIILQEGNKIKPFIRKLNRKIKQRA